MIERILAAKRRSIGAAEVDRILPAIGCRHVGPYIFLDHAGPHAQSPENRFDVAAHPHIGLSTLTYLLEGEIVHHDSLGTRQTIRPGEVNWMTAGRGISHSERVDPDFVARGGRVHALQLWVGLTAEFEEVEPDFQHLGRDELPVLAEPGATGRLIAGAAHGATSPLRTFSPQFAIEVQLAAGASFPLPTEHEERCAYVIEGRIRVGGDVGEARHMLVFTPGGAPAITADTDSRVLLLGGAPIAGPHMWWNFVSSRKERIEQAKRDWAEGRIPLPPDDADEFIPLPPDPAPRPEPMS